MPALISANNLLEAAGVSLTTVGDTTGLGGRNLLTSTLAEVWRTVGATGEVLVDLGSAQIAQVVALFAPRDGLLPAIGSTVRITASNVSQTGSEAYDSGTTGAATLSADGVWTADGSATVNVGGPSLSVDGTWTADGTITIDGGVLVGGPAPLSLPLGYQVWILPTLVSARFWRIVLTGAASQPYLQFGRLWIGTGLLTANSISADGYGLETADEPGRATIRRAQFTLGTLSQGEARTLERIGLAVGTQRQVLAVPLTLDPERSAIFGKFTAVPAPRRWQGFRGGQLYTATMTIQEDR